jgi:hypothetical protein
MVSQVQFHKIYQDSYKPFGSNAKVEGREEVGKFWLKKVRANF